MSIDDEILNEVGKELYNALSTVGFSYLKNTGISRKLIEDATRISKQFFDLDPNVKRQFADEKNFRGYVDLYKEGTNLERPKDIKEAYNFYMITDEDKNKMCPMNDVPELYDVMKEFSGVCKQLALRVLEVLSDGIGIKDKTYLTRCHSRMSNKDNFTTLRSLHYPPIIDDSTVQPNQIRLGEHTDVGSFTLLFQDQIGGLEVKNCEGEFVEAKPIPGTVLLNIGDLLQYWTDRRLKSTVHRIMIPQDEVKKRTHRQSIVYFVHPNFETKLEGLEYKSDVLLGRDGSLRNEKVMTAQQYVAKELGLIWSD